MMDSKPVEVRVLRVENGLYLSQWQESDGMIERYWLTEDMFDSLEGNQGFATNPKRGMPFSDNILDGFSLQLSNRVLERELRIRDIWKYEDVIRNPNGVIQSIQAALGVDLASLLNSARKETRR